MSHCTTATVKRALAQMGVAAFVAVGVTALSSAGQNPVAAAPAPTAAYVGVQPCRLADTRDGTGYALIDPTTIQISSRNACGIPAGATSLALTLTVVSPQTSGFLTAWPAAQARPTVSNLNFSGGQVRANGSITRLDSNGDFRVFTSVATGVVVDVVGAFVPATTAKAGRFVYRPPARLLDTRSGTRLAPASTVNIAVPTSIPADAVALALNITVTESAGAGFVTQYPTGQTMPTSSVLNVDRAGQTRAAAGIFPVSSAGATLYVSGGGHVVVDVVGYFTGPSAASSSDGLFTAYDPTRLMDTRGASPLGNGVPLYPGGGLELATGRGGSMAYNITSVDGNIGYVTAYPAGTDRPGTSTVNSVGGSDVVANFAITQMSTRGLAVFAQSQTHVLVDVQGWFSGPTAAATVAPPANTAPPVPQPSYSACITEGLSAINAKRSTALVANPAAEAFACEWAFQLARIGDISHSDSATRDAAVGCPTGENVAYSSGTSIPNLYSMWYASSGHMANITNVRYRSAGTGFVIRTDPNGGQRIFGVNVFALC
ncbi:MAG: hypothetical protein ABIR32_02345 [Ilumatobacteraceae bacterium]